MFSVFVREAYGEDRNGTESCHKMTSVYLERDNMQML